MHYIYYNETLERIYICYQNERCVLLFTTEHLFHVDGCAGAVAGAATGGFIGGVLLTAAIAGVMALVVLCRSRRKGATKLELVLSLCTYLYI